MSKSDVKAIIIICFILLVMSGIGVVGLKVYIDFVEQESKNTEKLYTGNVIITPDDQNGKDVLVVEMNKDLLNEISSAGSQTQTMKPNTVIDEDGYYYKQLNTYEKLIYDKIKSNKENMKSGTYKIEFGKSFNDLLSEENGTALLQEYYQSAIESYLYDNPDVFYLAPTKMYLNVQTIKKIFSTTYDVYIDCGDNTNYLAEGYSSKDQILEYENKIEQVVQKVITKTLRKNDYEKILIVHDYLVDNIDYDQTVSKDNIYNMYGAIVNEEAVCEGYAKAFKYLMNQVGVESIVVIGEATDSDGNTQNHAWNYVELNNTWYAADATWDDPILIGGGRLSKKHKYKYFLKGSVTMREDHTESYTFVENGKVYTHPTLSTSDYK